MANLISRNRISAVILGTCVLGLVVFAVFNAFALSYNGDSSALTASVALCKEAKAGYKANVENAKAKGLSSQLPQEEIDRMIQEIKDYRKQVCSTRNANSSLTSPVKLCKAAKASYKADVENAKAKGLSSQLPKEEIERMIQEIKDYRKQVCKRGKKG